MQTLKFPTLILSFFQLLISINGYSQNQLENGYIIKNNNDTVFCQIKNKDWLNNPKHIVIVELRTQLKKTVTIDDIKEFAINQAFKYKRFNILIDKSSDETDRLTDYSEPKYVNERAFLREIVAGSKPLYKYVNKNIYRYFIANTDSGVVQLVYKAFLSGTNAISENASYKTQLTNYLESNCSDLSNQIKQMQFFESELLNVFKHYYNCIKKEYWVMPAKSRKGKFHLAFQAGISAINASFKTKTDSKNVFEMPSKNVLNMGIEIEYVLPFNNNKWSVMLQPNFISYEATNYYNSSFISPLNIHDVPVTMKLKTLQFPFGIRHSMFINSKNKVYIDLMYNYHLFNSSENIIDTYTFKNDQTGSNLALGVGYKLKNKFGAKLIYNFSNSINNYNTTVIPTYKVTSIMCTWNLF